MIRLGHLTYQNINIKYVQLFCVPIIAHKFFFFLLSCLHLFNWCRISLYIFCQALWWLCILQNIFIQSVACSFYDIYKNELNVYIVQYFVFLYISVFPICLRNFCLHPNFEDILYCILKMLVCFVLPTFDKLV